MHLIFFIYLFFSITNVFSQFLPMVKIGNQIWMQKNFENISFRNGDEIKEIKSKEDWINVGYREEPAWCYYNFDSKNAEFGKFYNYFALSDSRNIAPIGWKVPTFQDFYILVHSLDPLCSKAYFVNNGSLAGGSLKIKDSDVWLESNCPQISSDFNAIAAGGYSPSIEYPEYDWDKLGEKAMFWCLTDWGSLADFIDDSHIDKYVKNMHSGKFKDKALVIRLKNSSCLVDVDDDPKHYGYSLRLLKED